jgi:predicted nuclease of predicted toxin-antitoxin system
MKFLVDAQLPPAFEYWLKEKGHDAVHVFNRQMHAAQDTEIAELAIKEKRILISKDEDFLSHYYPDRFAFLWLRCGNTTRIALFEWLEPRWSEIEKLLAKGEHLVEVQ